MDGLIDGPGRKKEGEGRGEGGGVVVAAAAAAVLSERPLKSPLT